MANGNGSGLDHVERSAAEVEAADHANALFGAMHLAVKPPEAVCAPVIVPYPNVAGFERSAEATTSAADYFVHPGIDDERRHRTVRTWRDQQ